MKDGGQKRENKSIYEIVNYLKPEKKKMKKLWIIFVSDERAEL